MADHITITHFTDPICPFAFSAEPLMRRLEWQLGANATWRIRLVGLAATVEELEERGLSVAMLDTHYVRFARDYGMPIDQTPRVRLVASVPVSTAIAAGGFTSPEHLALMVRAARVRHFAGELLDEPSTIRGVAVDAGLDPDEIERQAASRLAKDTMSDDMDAARSPSPEALAQPGRLAPWAGGLRYTCPSLEMTRRSDGRRIAAPGFQAREAYELAVANLIPGTPLRPAPESAREVLEWAPFPLATVEVAAVRDVDVDTVREELVEFARFTPVGQDGYWQITS